MGYLLEREWSESVFCGRMLEALRWQVDSDHGCCAGKQLLGHTCGVVLWKVLEWDAHTTQILERSEAEEFPRRSWLCSG